MISHYNATIIPPKLNLCQVILRVFFVVVFGCGKPNLIGSKIKTANLIYAIKLNLATICYLAKCSKVNLSKMTLSTKSSGLNVHILNKLKSYTCLSKSTGVGMLRLWHKSLSISKKVVVFSSTSMVLDLITFSLLINLPQILIMLLFY